MHILDDTRRLIASWRVYRRMAQDDARYIRLVADYAVVIRSRKRHFTQERA